MSKLSGHTKVGRLDAEDARHLDDDGFLLLRGVIPTGLIEPLRAAFEAGSSHKWPIPRGHGWRHALLDLDPAVQRVCRLPPLLAAVYHVLRTPFFLSQVEGREPRPGYGTQTLHRDNPASGTPQNVSALAFIDRFGPENGATQVVPGTHRGKGGEVSAGLSHSQAMVTEGHAGDILLFSPSVLHGAICNKSGAPRRSLLISYTVEALRDDDLKTRSLRAVRMNTNEAFGA